MPGGNDLPQHYRFAIAFYDALRFGDIYPAWIGETNLGFGDVGVRFYPPLAYYVVAFFRFLTSSWNAAIASSVCFWFFVGGSGVYLLAREWASERASLVAALLFMLMPYHANQVYNAGLFGEFAGLAILPFCFLFVQRIVSLGGVGNVVGLSIAYAFLILSHLPLTIVGSVALVLYSIPLMSREGWKFATIGKLATSVIVAAAASAFYWVRLVAELPFVKHSQPQFTDQAYDFRTNFLGSLLYVAPEKYEQTSLWFTDLLFVITLAMILPSLTICLIPSETIDRRKLIPWFGVFTLAVFLGTPASNILWEHIGLLQRIQFPWRLLGLLSLAGSMFVAASFEDLARIFNTKRRPLGILAVGLIAAGAVFTFAQVIRPASYPDRQAFDSSFERYRSDESYECWWPVWAKREAFKNRETVSAPTRTFKIPELVSAPTRKFASLDLRNIDFGAGAAEKVRVAKFYYPFWKATSDGDTLDVEPASDGTILVSIPAGERSVHIFFEEPAYETSARAVSVFVWLTLITIVTVSTVRRYASPKIA